ncbi:MAG TPA: cobalamin-dependent protein, partial [Polyangia bacterium]|jgi:methylmalonyl-CoA mutase C-terminal domain/subunit
VQESVDAVGLSIMSGAHMTLFPAVMDALKTRGANDILVFGGGIIPDEDVDALKKGGVSAIFKPGASTQEIIDWVETNIRPKHEGA